MTTSVNQPRPVQAQPSTKGLFKVILILAALCIGAAWLWHSWEARKAIPLSQPLPKSVGIDPAVVQAISFDMPIRCIDLSKPIVRLPGRGALTAPSTYAPCAGSDKKAEYTVEKQADGYLISSTTPNSDQFLCGGVPKEVGDLAQCKAVR